MSKNVYEGSCSCGKIKFCVEGKPIWIGYCHCESCRKATGAAAVTFVGVSSSDLTYRAGELKIFESSPGVRRGFCTDCGSPLTYESDRYDAYVQLYIGSFNQPEKLVPLAHVNCSERIAWFDTADQLTRFDGTGDDGSESWRDN